MISVGDDKESHTLEISWKVGNWLGRGDCFTVIDTPGTLKEEPCTGVNVELLAYS